MEPVCSGLQAQILRCYRDHLQEVLLCADLVRAYQHCVSSAHKARTAPPGLQVRAAGWSSQALASRAAGEQADTGWEAEQRGGRGQHAA